MQFRFSQNLTIVLAKLLMSEELQTPRDRQIYVNVQLTTQGHPRTMDRQVARQAERERELGRECWRDRQTDRGDDELMLNVLRCHETY